MDALNLHTTQSRREEFSSSPSAVNGSSLAIREVRQISVNDAVEQAFGLKSGQITEEGGLSKGHALLNQEFSAWKLAGDEVARGGTVPGGFFATAWFGIKTFWTCVFQGSNLVKEATANQELLKNPTEVTQAVKYLAGLRDRGVTIDLDQYREHGLARAKGDRPQINTENAVEQNADLILGSIKEKSKTGAFVTSSQKREALAELEQAVHAVAQLSDDFDAQRQMVAVVTMNIAKEAGIADGSREMEVLVDQMSHLWLKTAPVAPGEKAPLAVINYAGKLAQEFDASDLDSVYDKVRDHAALFAQASLTDLSGVAEDDMEALEKATAKFQTQIWDALKANPTFTSKMKTAVGGINQRIDALHNLTTTTDHVSAEVLKHFKGIASENLGTQTGEMHFIAQVMSSYGMTDDVFTLLRAYDGTFDEAKGTWDKMPLQDVVIALGGQWSATDSIADMLPENVNANLVLVLGDNTDGSDNVDIFKVFTDSRILGQAAVINEQARLRAQKGTSQVSTAEAKQSLFKSFLSSSKEITAQYEAALNYLRREGAPITAAVDHYDQKGKQAELEGLRRELQSLAVLASQGTTGRPELQKTLSGDGAARALNAIATPQGLREDIVTGMFAEPYVQSLGIRDPHDIDDTPLQQRHNLQDKDYYQMLATAMGLREANAAGSATLTHETLKFLNNPADAARILLTQGKMSSKEFAELMAESQAVRDAAQAVTDAMQDITDPVLNRSGKSHFIDLPSGERVELRVFNDERKAAFEQTLIKQHAALAAAQAAMNTPKYMIEEGKIERLTLAAKGNEERIAQDLVAGMNFNDVSEAHRAGMKKMTVNALTSALRGLQSEETAGDAFAMLQGTLATGALPERAIPADFDLDVESPVLPRSPSVEDFVLIEQEAPKMTAGQLLALIAKDGQEATAQTLAKRALGVDELDGGDDEILEAISAQLTRLQVEDSQEAAFKAIEDIFEYAAHLEAEEAFHDAVDFKDLSRANIERSLGQAESVETFARDLVEFMMGEAVDVTVEGPAQAAYTTVLTYLQVLNGDAEEEQKAGAFQQLNALFHELQAH
ncbi:MAG: hypothetical protein KDK64_01515 [Chlamydiia bacterium]|nr:hypothetical protein [Chlamydiia bacterium]